MPKTKEQKRREANERKVNKTQQLLEQYASVSNPYFKWDMFRFASRENQAEIIRVYGEPVKPIVTNPLGRMLGI